MKSTDVHSPEVRSYNMSRIRSANTGPEMLIRRGLHSRGRRYRLHAVGLPGRPDLLFSKSRAVLLVHGCFWHGHSCPRFRMPATRTEFWSKKIENNVLRDQRVYQELALQGWRTLVVWECSLKGRRKRPLSEVLDMCERFLDEETESMEIEGTWD
ncbi:very short patch repair endonuclease [Rhizobium dioscoreae]|uniref:very short patch repair endonuclease n=1 Tax=Rhizobium TaxID=379 RepID=UPI0022781EE2|nr:MULTISPECIES: very short patch repair endonuclease [Rhizobium]